jgi:hypothetical protein
MRHQVCERIGPWVNEAIDSYVAGSPIVWEPQLMPNAQGQVVVVCVFWIPGPGAASVQGSFTIPDPLATTRAFVVQQTREFLHRLYTARDGATEARKAAEEPVEEPPAPEGSVPFRNDRQTESGLFIAKR